MCLSANQNVKVDLYTSPLPAVLKMVSFLIIFRLTTLFENNLKCLWVIMSKGFSGVKGFSGKESACQFKKMQEMWVWSLGWEDPLEEEMAIHSSILVWKIPRTEDPGGLQSLGSQRVGQTEWLRMQACNYEQSWSSGTLSTLVRSKCSLLGVWYLWIFMRSKVS